jgi:GDPmannose 4,6-dehydratase
MAARSVAFVTGVTGQDGSYLVERLLDGEVEVHGLVRTIADADRLARIRPELNVHVGDLADGHRIAQIVAQVRPSHLYNLAGGTSVAASWANPADTAETIGSGTARLLQAAWSIHDEQHVPIRFVQASSAEVFGQAADVPQTESTSLRPINPYGAAKVFAQTIVSQFRSRGLFASNAILYNHESPRRPESFVARKITRGVAAIALGQQDKLVLGNLEARRDWGYAPDVVDALIRIGSADSADDYIVATGVAHSVREFLDAAFQCAGIPDWEPLVRVDPTFLRPADATELIGDASRLRKLGWKPSVDFAQLVELMVSADLNSLKDARSAQA